MKKLLPVAILAVVILFCSASTAAAWVSVSITPQEQVTTPQISEFWFGATPSGVCQANKTVTYAVTVATNSLPVSVAVIPGKTPTSWFSWLAQTLLFPDTSKTWPLNLKIPLIAGKDAGGQYTITVTAVDAGGNSASATATLIVQDHDYVTETFVSGTGGTTLNEKFTNLDIATKVDKQIEFLGEVDCFTKNEYLLMDAKGNNSNFEQESVISEFKATMPGSYLYGSERFQSCAAMGGTGVDIKEMYLSYGTMESRCENINHHMTGWQARKTELCTYNSFTNGSFMVDVRQSIPCTKKIAERQEFFGNLTAAKHIIFRGP
jgi:hypothetical protein